MKSFLPWFFAVLFTLYVGSADAWSNADTARQVGISLLMVVDAGQTADIKSKGLKERNPVAKYILGSEPDKVDTALYFAAAIGLNYVVARALPSNYRHVFQYVTLGFQGAVVGNNYNIGLRWGF